MQAARLSHLVKGHRTTLTVRADRGFEYAVCESDLVGTGGAEAIPEDATSLGQEDRPHLQDRVREAGLEDATGDGGPDRLTADVQLLPHLLTSDSGHVSHG